MKNDKLISILNCIPRSEYWVRGIVDGDFTSSYVVSKFIGTSTYSCERKRELYGLNEQGQLSDTEIFNIFNDQIDFMDIPNKQGWTIDEILKRL